MGETVETVTVFIFLGSKIIAAGNSSHEIKRCLLVGRKSMSNLDTVLKSTDITLPTNIHIVKAMIFPVVTYRCELNHKEAWVPNNWHFWMAVLEKTLGRIRWTARRSVLKESSLNIHWKDWCWSSKTSANWCKEPTHEKRPWCWRRLEAKEEKAGWGWDG